MHHDCCGTHRLLLCWESAAAHLEVEYQLEAEVGVEEHLIPIGSLKPFVLSLHF